MNTIGYDSKNAVVKQNICSKYHQLIANCNSLHVSISCVVQFIDFNHGNIIQEGMSTQIFLLLLCVEL